MRRGKRSQAAALVPRPRPTPAVPSASTTTAPVDRNQEIDNLPIGDLTLDVPIANAPKPKRVKPPPFRFLDLPHELRLEVYGYHFANTGHVLDLDPDNYKRIHQKLAILRTCSTIYREASYLFYSTHPVRIFSTHPGRFHKIKKPMLARMKPGQRAAITSLELRLGPGWSKPPKSWAVTPALGLEDCVHVRKLTVFVECDPGNDVFRGFRQAEGFYEGFSQSLLEQVLEAMPWVDYVEFDAWTSVKKSGALVRGLLGVVADRGLKQGWGPERGWTDAEEVDVPKPMMDLNAPILSAAEVHNLLLRGAGIEAFA